MKINFLLLRHLSTGAILFSLIAVMLSSCGKNETEMKDSEPAITEITETEMTDAAQIEDTYQFGSNLLSCDFHIQEEFDYFISQAQVYDTQGDIISGTVPHHLLAGRMITSFFNTAAISRPDIETVVILAPMHEPHGMKLSTTLSDWAAPNGLLPNERSFSETFISELGAIENDSIITADHSAAALIPFVKYYFPDVSVSVLLVSSLSDMNISDRLTEVLFSFSEEKNCLFVFSVDFSHYLNPVQTALRDIETREAILSGDINKIRFMNDKNLDSPRTICTFLQLTERLDGKISELDHSNSLIISELPHGHPDFDEGLTSYFIFVGS